MQITQREIMSSNTKFNVTFTDSKDQVSQVDQPVTFEHGKHFAKPLSEDDVGKLAKMDAEARKKEKHANATSFNFDAR
ncbi:hypothetical protein PROFUN_10184 [Planoprotostelium fungivorum]|uniref:Uncharacterized protein n=1 Tax=Planoprotostelium fungivorum TaxID=1890364 RepID=A0A2P6MQ27_9EUKA|nr:hypothetical protein PROFUN_10184 [Planoprotostelium fungivorum]